MKSLQKRNTWNICHAVCLTVLFALPGISRADTTSTANSSAVGGGQAISTSSPTATGGQAIGLGQGGQATSTSSPTATGGQAVGLGQGGTSGAQVIYAPSSTSNYEAPKPTIFPPNGFATGVPSPNMFGTLDQGPNAVGTMLSVYLLDVCHQYNVVQDLGLLTQKSAVGESGNTTITFDPLPGYAMKQPGSREQSPKMTEAMFDNKLDTESSYMCLGALLIQAKENSNMVNVTETGMFHEVEVFLASEAFTGYPYVVAMTTEPSLANQKRLETEGIGATMAPSISGMMSSILGAGMGSVSVAKGETNPQTKKGTTFLILAKLNPWEKGGRLIAPPKVWNAQRKAAFALDSGKNSNHVPEKAVGAGAVQ